MKETGEIPTFVDGETLPYRKETLDAMAEARRISRDPNIGGYTTMEELIVALNRDE